MGEGILIHGLNVASGDTQETYKGLRIKSLQMEEQGNLCISSERPTKRF